MTWNKAIANRFERWSAHVTDDIPFYVRLARRRADGRCPLPRVRARTVHNGPLRRRFRRQ